MMSPPEPPDPNAPYPGIRSALMLTLLAILAAGFTGIAFIDFGILAAVGIGQAIGVGAIASMGAQRVPEPQAERLGLRGLELESIPILLCLIPAFLLVSEVDNFAYDLTEATKQSDSEYAFEMNSFDESTGSGSFDGSDGSVVFGTESESPGTSVRPETNSDGSDSLPTEEPKPEGEDRDEAPAAPEELKLIDPDNPSSVLQAIVVMVGITPIVEGFLFFGVIQQGLVFRLGLVRGVAFTALFWTLLRPMAIAGIVRFLFATVAFMGLGGLLGIARAATRSILAPIFVGAGWACVQLVAIVNQDRLDLPGLNVEGTHLPVMVSVASAALVVWAGWTLFQEAERQTPDKDLGQGGQGRGSTDTDGRHNIHYIHQDDRDDEPPSTLH